MRRRTSGQSLVEMAFVMPILVILTLGIIDMGYYVYSYATIFQSVRNAAEKAVSIPPYPNKVNDPNDICVQNIRAGGRMSFYSANMQNQIQISYPSGKRALGEPIQLSLTQTIQPLTPLWRFVRLGTDGTGTFTLTVTNRRSIEGMGDNPNAANLMACTP